MSLEYFLMPESKKVLKKQNDEVMSKGHRNEQKELPKEKTNNLNNQINNVVLDYNPKYNINIMNP